MIKWFWHLFLLPFNCINTRTQHDEELHTILFVHLNLVILNNEINWLSRSIQFCFLYLITVSPLYFINIMTKKDTKLYSISILRNADFTNPQFKAHHVIKCCSLITQYFLNVLTNYSMKKKSYDRMSNYQNILFFLFWMLNNSKYS